MASVGHYEFMQNSSALVIEIMELCLFCIKPSGHEGIKVDFYFFLHECMYKEVDLTLFWYLHEYIPKKLYSNANILESCLSDADTCSHKTYKWSMFPRKFL